MYDALVATRPRFPSLIHIQYWVTRASYMKAPTEDRGDIIWQYHELVPSHWV